MLDPVMEMLQYQKKAIDQLLRTTSDEDSRKQLACQLRVIVRAMQLRHNEVK